jgi:hypothetical protein
MVPSISGELNAKVMVTCESILTEKKNVDVMSKEPERCGEKNILKNSRVG